MSLANILRGLALLIIVSSPAVSEEIRDYYAEPGINPFKETLNDSFHESVDPFSGTLQLKYTDLHIPGNGGMDVTITRTYTSLQTNAYPTLNQNGLGWTMHFGRIVIAQSHLPKLCNQGAFPLTTRENPSLELPDGGREILALSSMHNDGTMITRSNWIAKCVNGNSMLVTAPNGTRYTMDRFDNFQEQPALLTTRIEDVRGNWIAIDYANNALGINYITQIRRSEDGVVAIFEYEDQNTAGIAVSAITAGNQRVSYAYESISGFLFDNYKKLVSATRPDGRSWVYTYNPKMPDPNPNDDLLEDGIASYSLVDVTYPFGARIAYTYQYVLFDPGASTERTTAIHTKTVSGGDITGGLWTYTFAPHSEPYDDTQGGTLRYDVTTVTAPEARYVYKHYGKDFRSGGLGTIVFVRPSFVGLLAVKETWSRSGSANLLERVANSWGQRKISDEDFWHGGGYRDWWRDDGTYAAVLNGEYVSRDNAISGSTYAHARLFYDFDAFGNPGRVYSRSNTSGQPGHQVLYTYHNDIARWIVGIPDDETHQKVVGETETTVGTVTRDINQYGQVDSIDEFGEESRYTYHGTGDLHTARDARGKTSTYSNYKRGIAQTEERPESVTILRVVNDSGTLRSESDGRGNVTRYTYDDLHRLTSIDYPIKADASIDYNNGSGSYLRILTRGNYRQTDTINDFGETIRVERRDTTTGQSVVRTSLFDAFGRETFTSYPNDTIGTTTTYDALGRTERIRHPDNSFVGYVHDDAQTTVTNERGNQTRYLYAVLGTSYSLDDPVVIREPESVTTNIHRDVWGNVVELFQGEQLADNTVRGYGKTYRYNARRLLVEAIEPEVGTTVYEHDAVGNVNSERVNDLPIVTFEFDGLNRRTLVNFSDATPDLVTEYDDSGNIERVTKGNTEWFYTIDENGNLRSERLTINHPLLAPRVYLLSRSYSDLDVLSTITYPSGLVIDYAPDGFGRATRVGTFASNIGYHPSGSLAGYQLANGVTTSIGINQRLMTQSIAAPGVVNLAYGYDAGGNVMNITDAIDSSKSVVMNSSSYDALDRLRNVNGKWGAASFTYDFHGNLKTKAIGQRGLKYGIDATRRARQVDRYTTSSPSDLTGAIRLDYDKRGNTAARRNLTGVSTSTATLDEKLFTYDAASHLIRARVIRTTTTGTTTVAFKEYAYDGNGQRVLEQQHGSYDIRFSVHGSDGQLMFEDALATCTRTDHVRLGSLGIAKSDDQLAAPALDTDGDQITDCYETALGLNPNSAADAAADSDGDGLTNLQEFRAGTSLTRTDTDGDGLSDRDELERDLTDPNLADTDGDGLSDGVEAANPQLDPRSADKDHDGVTDFWETRLQTNPAIPDGLLDTDSDGFSNRQESGAGADPSQAATIPARGTQVWSANMLAAVWKGAVIGPDRTIYVTTLDERVRAFYPDGTPRWSLPMTASQVSEPTVGADGTIYVVSQVNGAPHGQARSFVHALNPNGTQRWIWPSADYLASGVAIGEGGRLYIGGSKVIDVNSFRYIVSINSSGADPVVHSAQGSSINITPTVAASGDVYVVEAGGKLHAFSKALALKWTYQLRRSTEIPVTVGDDGTVYVSDSDGYHYAITSAGTLRWERLIAANSLRSATTIGSDGTLYLGTYQSRLMALNPATGATIWDVATSGTTYTPTVAANGNIYATTYAGDLLAFDSAGVELWKFATASRVSSPPLVDRDGTIYFSSETGQLYAVADNGGGPGRTPWPSYRHDSAGANYRCFHEPTFSIVADGDGDGIDDCAEVRYGLNPINPADATADMDGDGLNNREEHQRGTRLDLTDTDGDGLSDGLEVLTYHTDPRVADTDHDTISDGLEVARNTNPLDATDSALDSDNDGFTNRQESFAGTDPFLGSSVPVDGQVVRDLNTSTVKQVAVASDGTVYQVTANESSTSGTLDALYPDFTVKWSVPFNSHIGLAPMIGADGTVYAISSREGIFAYRPDGTLRWVHRIDWSLGNDGILSQPAIGSDGTIYYVYSRDGGSAMVNALTPEGTLRPGWNSTTASGNASRLAVAPNGTVAVHSGSSVKLLSTSGSEQWAYYQTFVPSANGFGVAFGTDGALYVTNGAGLHSLNPATGERLWQKASTSGNPLIDPNNRVIVYCAQNFTNLCAVNSTGQTVWSEQTGLIFRGTPVIDANGTIIVASDNRLLAFNGNGTMRWNKTLTSSGIAFQPHYPVVLNDGLIYLTSNNKSALVIGSGRGLATSGWPSRDRDNKGTRNSAGVPQVAPSTAPSVAITSPTTNAINLDLNESRLATAVASDVADGNLSASIRWTSSIDGQLATGASVSLLSLSVGTHTVTATVTDSAGLLGSASFTVNKGSIPPVISLVAPQPQAVFDQGQSIVFSASAQDLLDGNLTSRIRWTSDRDGELGTGGFITRTNLTVGRHEITLSATDNTGGVGSRVIAITVEVRGPNITIERPANMSTLEFGQPAQFMASAFDAVDGNRTSTLNWVSDRDGLIGTGGSFTSSTLSLGAHVITVTASDLGGTITAVTIPILVRHIPPVLTVVSPATWSTIETGTSVQFSATAIDGKDGNIGANIHWSSSLDGPLGTGAGPFNRSDLSVGNHTLTCAVTDSDSQTVQIQRSLAVTSPNNNAPQVHIVTPIWGETFYATDPVHLSATASDIEDPALTIQWSSSRDGAIGNGSSLTLSTLSIGTHLINALVVDSGGAKAAWSHQIEILPMPANFSPSVTITPPPYSSRYTTIDAFPLTGTAADREDGNISSRIQWSSNLSGPLGTGSTIFASGLAPGVHTITASVTDNYGATESTEHSIEIFGSGVSRHFEDTFPDFIGSGWVPYDDGIPGASSWWVDNGRAVEDSDAQAGDAAEAALPKPGTYLLQTEGAYWLDYRLEATLRSTDDDALGLMFRYVDNDNYYRFSLDRERGYRRLVKKVNGVFTSLWYQDTTGYSLNTNVNVVITAQGSQLTLSIGGTQVYSGVDTAHRRGSVALYAWGENQAQFDNVRVFNLRTSTSNDPPLVAISSPANDTSVLVGTPVTFNGTATDFEQGTMSSSIVWSSSRDGALGTGASLTPGSLSVGAHVITARATDTQNASGTATINLTITEPFNNPPTINVTAPTEGASFNQGTLVSFAATASDIEDGTISNGITWTSSRSGSIGTGASFTASLVPGTHTITARIEDSGLKFATATRNITIVVPNNNQPTIILSTPLNGAAFGVGQSVALSATAADTEDGNLTSSIAWSSNRVGALGTGGTVNTTALTHGIHTITAIVNDSMGGTISVPRTINVVSTAATLLRDDFNDNNTTGWTSTSATGATSGPAQWNATPGYLRQTSDIHTTPVNAGNAAKLGTFNRWSAGSSWTNYSVTTELRSGDGNTLGVMFRYTNETNYYRFSMDSQFSQRRLQKIRNGTWTTLWSDSTAYTLNRTYVLEVVANGSTITVKLDGTQLWSGTDSSNPHTTGTVAMYSWKNTDARFDNVLVRNLSVAFSNANEPRRGVERLRSNEPLLAKRGPAREPNPVPPRAPERIALVTYPTSDYRLTGGGVR